MYESRPRAAGDAVSMRVIDGADHGDVVRPGHSASAAIADEIAAALR
jgi:acetyl esterase/lipase